MRLEWDVCGVCGEGLSHDTHQPVALPACGHSYCRNCLLRLRQEKGPYFPCPECRTAHKGEDIANLPTNYLALRLLAEGKETKESHKEKHVEENVKIGDKLRDPLLENEEKMELKKQGFKENDTERDPNLNDAPNNMNPSDLNIPKQENASDEDNTSRRDWRRVGLKCSLSRKRKVCLVIFGVVVFLAGLGAVIAIAIAPAILDRLGFGEKGVRKDTYATGLMSSTAKQNNGTIPADSMVSWLQKAGKIGLESDHKAYAGLIGAGGGLVIAVVLGAFLGLGILVVKSCRRGRRGMGLIQ